MNFIVSKLSETEETAAAIIDHAIAKKSELKQCTLNKQAAFVKELALDTQTQLESIAQERTKKMAKELTHLEEKNNATIQALQNEYDLHHTAYARAILKKIIEV